MFSRGFFCVGVVTAAGEQKKHISSMRCAMMFRDWLWPNSINSFCFHGSFLGGVQSLLIAHQNGPSFFVPAICSLSKKNILSWFVPQCGRQSSRCVSCVPIAIESWTNNSFRGPPSSFSNAAFLGPNIEKHPKTWQETKNSPSRIFLVLGPFHYISPLSLTTDLG